MNKNSLLLLIVTAGIALVASPNVPGYRPVATATAAAQTNASAAAADPAPASCRLDGQFRCRACATNPACPEADFADAVEHLRSDDFYLIAIVPDPTHTHLGLFFDRQIEAVSQAVQASGYVFQHAQMPWSAKEPVENSSFLVNLQRDRFQDTKEKYPGVMTFLNTTAKKTLVVFVVGERPTSGVNGEQFRQAVTFITVKKRSSPPLRLSILGPTFSGSLDSLKKLLAENPLLAPTADKKGVLASDPVVIHSGTTSDADSIEKFRSARPQFHSFIENDCVAMGALMSFIKSEGYEARQVALLTEDGTAYGNALKTDAAGVCDDSAGANVLYFPREIAHLRSAYQRDIQDQPQADGGRAPARTTLRANFSESGGEDTLSPYAAAQTPLSQESVLLGIVSSLQKRGIRFVVVRATNPIDTLFLARYLRRAHPGARVVTLGADLLFRRESDDPQLRGVLAVTPYPLIPRIDLEMLRPATLPPGAQEANGVERVFPSSDSVGTYNATLAAIHYAIEPGNTYDTKALPPLRYAQYGWPTLAGRPAVCDAAAIASPPLWLVGVGDVGYWPITLLRTDSVGPTPTSRLAPVSANSAQPPDCTGVGFEPFAPLSWRVFCIVSMLLTFAYAMLLLFGSATAASPTLATFAPMQLSSRATVLVAITLMLSALCAIVMWPLVRWYEYLGPKGHGLLWVMVIMLIGLMAISCYSLYRRKAPWHMAGLIAVAAVAARYYFTYSWPDARGENFVLYRSWQLTSGLSPLLPLLFFIAAGLWRAWYSLTALSYLDERTPLLPRNAQLTDENRFLSARLEPLSHESNAGLRDVMDPWNFSARVIGFALVPTAVFAAGLLDFKHPVQAFEAPWFEWLYATGLIALVLGLFCSLFRLVVVWSEFKSFLAALESLPMQGAFKQVKDLTWRPLWRASGRPLTDSGRFLARLAESLQALANLELPTSLVAQAVAQQFAQEQAAVARVNRSLNAETQAEFVRRFKRLREEVAYLSGGMLQDLDRRWTAASPSNLPKRQQPVDPVRAEEENFVARLYVNFILVVLTRMRTLVMCVAGTYALLALSFVSYPFGPRPSFNSLIVLLLLAIVGVVGVTFARMHQNTILSYITDTKPGQLGGEFYIRLASFAAVPILSLLAVQFPEFNTFLFSWIEPALRALK